MIEFATSADLHRLRELWLELHHHHLRIATYPTPTDDGLSWEVRRDDYRSALDNGTGFLLIVTNDSEVRGYAIQVRMLLARSTGLRGGRRLVGSRDVGTRCPGGQPAYGRRARNGERRQSVCTTRRCSHRAARDHCLTQPLCSVSPSLDPRRSSPLWVRRQPAGRASMSPAENTETLKASDEHRTSHKHAYR
jgi:hypothetical protein